MPKTYSDNSAQYAQANVSYNGATTTVNYRARKGFTSGYNCFIAQFISFTNQGLAPLRRPDGTLW